MPVRTAEAEWKGNLTDGTGQISLGSGAFNGPYSFRTRFADAPGTNPEELIGAAHAGCFPMALSAQLTKAGFPPSRIHTTAKVHFEKEGEGFAISRIELNTEASVPGIDSKVFAENAEAAKTNCPVSKALRSVPIVLVAK